MKVMNIIYLVSDLRPAGPTNQAYNLVTGLLKMKCKPILVTLFEEQNDSWIERFREANIQIVQLHTNRKRLKDAARKLDVIIEEYDIQIVHSSGLSADTVNRYLKTSVYKINTIRQEFNQIAEDSNCFKRFIAKFITKLNYHAMNKRFACSKILSTQVQKSTGYAIDVVQNGVDIERFIPISKDEKNKLRKKLSLPTDKIIYISTGVFYMRKQMIELVDSFISLNRSDIVLLLVGDGQTFDKIKDKVKDIRNKNIYLTGKVSNPLIYYQSSDVFISASTAEGLPNTVMEAMACGLPCILSDIGPHKEILEFNSNAGLLFHTKNYDDLKNCIVKSFNWDLNEKSNESLSLVTKHLSKYSMAANYYEVYRNLINNQFSVI